MEENYIPVIIVTGFLGSGKTTLLSNWLKYPNFQNTVVIVNEFGNAGLDQRVLRRVEENTILLGGGCACCNIRSDFVNELGKIIDLRDRGEMEVGQIVIETSGLADPAPIMFSIMTDSMLKHHYRIKHVISCLDSANGRLHLDSNIESVKQISVADKVIFTKTDLVEKESLAELYDRIKTINPIVKIFEAEYGKIDPNQIFYSENYEWEPNEDHLMKSHNHDPHTTDVKTISIEFEEPLNWAAFGIWLSALLYAHGESIYRVKGILDTGEGGPVVLNGVQHIIHPPEHLESWKDEKHQSKIVFIMRNIEPEAILDSLKAFQTYIGSRAEIKKHCLGHG